MFLRGALLGGRSAEEPRKYKAVLSELLRALRLGGLNQQEFGKRPAACSRLVSDLRLLWMILFGHCDDAHQWEVEKQRKSKLQDWRDKLYEIFQKHGTSSAHHRRDPGAAKT